MRFIKKYAEAIIVSLTIASMTVANFWHVIWFWFQKPANTIYLGITHYYEDYFYYLSIVKQGMEGAWLTKNLFTTEVVPATPLWLVNLYIGKIGSLFGLQPWTSYNIAVLAIAILWLVTIYKVIRLLLPTNALLRISAFVITVTASPMYLLQTRPDGELFVNPWLYFYNYTSAFNRIGGVFHLILQNILSVLAIVVAGKLIGALSTGIINQKEFIKKTSLLTLLLVSLMFINPAYVLIDVFAIAATAFLFFTLNPKLKTLRLYVFIALFTGSVLTISYFLINQTFSLPFYRYFRDFENTVSPTIPDIFFHSMGIILVPIAIGIIPYLLKKDPLRVLGLVYAVIPIVLYFSDIPKRLGIPYFRLHQPPAYIFFGVMAAEGFLILSNSIIWVLKKILSLRHSQSSMLNARNPKLILFSLLTILFIIYHLPVLRYEIADRMGSYWLPSWLNAMDKGTYDGLMSLNNEPKSKNVLAFNNLEILVPAFSGHTVYVGHKSLTYDYAGKIAQAYNFYYDKMTPEEGKNFLESNNIGYILWHKPDGAENLQGKYPFLTKIFNNVSVTIFKNSNQ